MVDITGKIGWTPGKEAIMMSRIKPSRLLRLLRLLCLCRSERGQTAVEYVLVISLLSIALYFATDAFSGAFSLGITTLSDALGTSLTDDGIRL